MKMGYAREAGKKVLTHLFHIIGTKEIYGDCDIHNENLWRLLERMGF